MESPQFARISLGGGGLVVPADTPYDWELVLELLGNLAGKHESVRLQLGRERWTIRTAFGPEEACVACGGTPPGLVYAHQRGPLCARCARLHFAGRALDRLDLREAPRRGATPPRWRSRPAPTAGRRPPHQSSCPQ